MKVKLIAHTPNPEKVVAAAAKLCYSNAQIDTLLDGLTEEKICRNAGFPWSRKPNRTRFFHICY